MKNLIFLFLLSLASHFANGEVTGQAFLEGQTDHSGIKVKFIPNSPTAILDSTYTIADGSYSIALPTGIYFVTFSKPGYQTLEYNNANAVPLTANSILSDVTLLEGNLVYLSGYINGTLTSNNIYIVVSDIWVSFLDSLFIQPGTIIKFQSECDFGIEGKLRAIGTEEDKIRFTSYQTNPDYFDWLDFTFWMSCGNSVLKHCIVEYGRYLNVFGGNVLIENCEIHHDFSIQAAYNSFTTIKNCYFHDFEYVLMSGVPAYFEFLNNLIEMNNANTNTVTIGSSGLIENNIFYSPEAVWNYNHDAICLWPDCSVFISNNIFNNCRFAINTESITTNASAIIVNNVFLNSINGIRLNENSIGSNFLIQSNIISGCDNGIYAGSQIGDLDISSNNVWNNATNYNCDISGIGILTNINNNGDSCDLYLNISMNPFFVDIANFDFHVYEGSPVIDAGSNSNVISEFDMDGNPRILDGNGDGNAIVDMGVYEVPVELILTSEFTCSDSVCSDENLTIQFQGNSVTEATYHWDFDGGIIASGSGQGPYEVYWVEPGLKVISLYISLGYNYSETTYHPVVVLQTAEVSITVTASTNPICSGDEVIFTAYPVNGGENPTYQWKLNGQNVGTNSPIYTNSNLQAGNMVHCILTSSEECVVQPSVQSNIIFMGVFQYPVVTIAALPNDTACITETITLNAGNPGCTYLWSTGQTTQSIVVSNTSGPTGGLQDYSVEVIKGGICSGYDTTSVYFDPCTGIKDLTAASGINIFPNPSREDFYIQIKEIIKPVSITLLSSQGILIEEFKVMPSESNSPFKVDLSEYPNGIYFIKFQYEEIFEVRKIIKE